MNGLHRTKLCAYSRGRQMLGASLHIAFSCVTQKVLSKMAHLNTTFKSFSLLFYLERRPVQEFLAAPPLCYGLLVHDFFQLACLSIPKIFMGNKKNP